MPLNTETITIEEAVTELEDERDQLADEIAQITPADRTQDNSDFVSASERAGEVERYLGGLEWAREEFGNDAEFVLSGLATQETLEVADRVNDLQNETITPTQSTDNISTIFWVAYGLEDAPFVDAGDEFEDVCATVRALPRQVTDWLESRISDLSTVGNRSGSSFDQLVAEKTEQYHQTSS